VTGSQRDETVSIRSTVIAVLTAITLSSGGTYTLTSNNTDSLNQKLTEIQKEQVKTTVELNNLKEQLVELKERVIFNESQERNETKWRRK
jgi:Tfp pilus assembly protein PilO